jgi:hypothetical protein
VIGRNAGQQVAFMRFSPKKTAGNDGGVLADASQDGATIVVDGKAAGHKRRRSRRRYGP